MYYWQTPDGTGQLTLLWKFIPGSYGGHCHFGHEPPCTRPPWGEEDEGNQALPTPYGRKFEVFVMEEMESLGDAYEDGLLVMPEDALLLDDDEWRLVRRLGNPPW